MVETRTIGSFGIVLGGALLAAALAVALFWAVPAYTPLNGWTVLAALVAMGLGTFVAGRVAESVFPGYNVAEVEVDDVITGRARSRRDRSASRPTTSSNRSSAPTRTTAPRRSS